MIRTRKIPEAGTILCLLAVVACVLAIWLPFGFALTGLIEEWGLLGLMELGGPSYVAGLGNMSADVALRPLNEVPFVLANVLSPDSFVAWHLLLMTALVVKGCASSYLVWKVTRSKGFAALAGVLVLVYPAETMQLSFRALHINWSLALALSAGSVFILAWHADSQRKARLWGLAAAALLLVAILIYEAAFTFVVLPFLVLFAAEGWRPLLGRLRDRAGVVIAWLTSAGGYVLYAWLMSRRGSSYQASLLGGHGLLGAVSEALPKLFSVGATRAVLGGWIDSVRMTVSEFDSYVYLAAATLVIVALIGSASRAARNADVADPRRESAARALRLALAGSVLMLAGYVPYLSSASHIAISQRTFLFASPGAAMLWASALFGISLVAKPFARAICAGLIFFGLATQLVQFNHYVRLAEVQRTLLRNIVENFDGNSGNKTLLIMDESNYLGHTWMLDSGNLSLALGYFYRRSIGPVQICHLPSMDWQEFDALGRKGTCLDMGSEWVFRYQKAPNGPAQPHIVVPADTALSKANALVLRLNVDGAADKNPQLDEYRKGLLTSGESVASRFRNILLEPRWEWYKTMFKDERSQPRYRWSFGNWWSLELPVRGSGWREAEWSGSGFSHEASAWKFTDNSMLIFEFTPVAGDYVLRGSFEAFANNQIRDKTTILLNGSGIPLRWVSDKVFEARVPNGVLHQGVNRIDFSAPVDDNYYGLSEKLHSFELEPAPKI